MRIKTGRQIEGGCMVAHDCESDVAVSDESVGIMVFSPTCHVMYANRAARYFLEQLRRQERNPVANAALPVSILELFQQMLAWLQKSRTIPCQPPHQIKRLATGKLSFLLQAFGLPDRLGTNRVRVVITMHAVHSLETGSKEASLLV
jgi:hypothetical protein